MSCERLITFFEKLLCCFVPYKWRAITPLSSDGETGLAGSYFTSSTSFDSDYSQILLYYEKNRLERMLPPLVEAIDGYTTYKRSGDPVCQKKIPYWESSSSSSIKDEEDIFDPRRKTVTGNKSLVFHLNEGDSEIKNSKISPAQSSKSFFSELHRDKSDSLEKIVANILEIPCEVTPVDRELTDQAECSYLLTTQSNTAEESLEILSSSSQENIGNQIVRVIHMKDLITPPFEHARDTSEVKKGPHHQKVRKKNHFSTLEGPIKSSKKTERCVTEATNTSKFKKEDVIEADFGDVFKSVGEEFFSRAEFHAAVKREENDK